MKKKQIKYRSHCPINYSLDIFGDKWSLLVIRDLLFKEKKYYMEFLEADEKVSTNILADRLVKLENHGLISKSIDKTKRSKMMYSLTNKGIDLLPMMLEMIAWGAKHDNETDAPTIFIQKFKKNKKSLIKELLSKVNETKQNIIEVA